MEAKILITNNGKEKTIGCAQLQITGKNSIKCGNILINVADMLEFSTTKYLLAKAQKYPLQFICTDTNTQIKNAWIKSMDHSYLSEQWCIAQDVNFECEQIIKGK